MFIFAIKIRIRGKTVIRKNLISAWWWCAETPDSTTCPSLSILSDKLRKTTEQKSLWERSSKTHTQSNLLNDLRVSKYRTEL